jgi:hypothetical protein
MAHKGEIVIKTGEAGAWQFSSEDGRAYKEAYREKTTVLRVAYAP